MEGMTLGYPVDAYAIEQTLTRDGDAGIKLGFTQRGADPNQQLIIIMSEPLAWAIASKILHLTGTEPITPEDEGWDSV